MGIGWLLAVIDRKTSYTTRSFCIYEAAVAVSAVRQNDGAFFVCLAQKVKPKLADYLKEHPVDSANAKARRAGDKESVDRYIVDHCGGFDKVDFHVQSEITKAIESGGNSIQAPDDEDEEAELESDAESDDAESKPQCVSS